MKFGLVGVLLLGLATSASAAPIAVSGGDKARTIAHMVESLQRGDTAPCERVTRGVAKVTGGDMLGPASVICAYGRDWARSIIRAEQVEMRKRMTVMLWTRVHGQSRVTLLFEYQGANLWVVRDTIVMPNGKTHG